MLGNIIMHMRIYVLGVFVSRFYGNGYRAPFT